MLYLFILSSIASLPYLPYERSAKKTLPFYNFQFIILNQINQWIVNQFRIFF